MTKSKSNLVVVILGPTASGKTDLGIHLAKYFSTEIISADSRQFFRELEIGTAKPEKSQLLEVKHHLIDSHSIVSDYNAFDFEKDAVQIIEDILGEHPIVFVVGGSGLYLHGIVHGFDEDLPESDFTIRQGLRNVLKNEGIESLQSILKNEDPEGFASIDIQNPARLIRAIEICRMTGKKISEVKSKSKTPRNFDVLQIGIDCKREELYEKINNRVDEMMNRGLEKEVRTLEKYRDKNALKTVGYQELFRYFDGEYTQEEAIEKIKVNSRRYAKRQMSWFRRYSDIQWFKADEIKEITTLIQRKIEELS